MWQRGVRPCCKQAEIVEEVEFKPAVPEQIRRLFLRLPGCNWIVGKRRTVPVTLLVGRVSGCASRRELFWGMRYALIYFFSIELWLFLLAVWSCQVHVSCKVLLQVSMQNLSNIWYQIYHLISLAAVRNHDEYPPLGFLQCLLLVRIDTLGQHNMLTHLKWITFKGGALLFTVTASSSFQVVPVDFVGEQCHPV